MAWPVGEDQPSFRPDRGGQSRPEAGGAQRLSGPGERGALAPGLCPLAAVGARERARWRSAMTAGKPAYYITRSEEHTSELQSLMRNSYAVFCLTKKN